MLVSPVVESCPSDNKEKAMSMLHSFYCWGHVGVVLLSTLFFQAAGIENWKLLAAVWAVVPLVNAFAFTKVPSAFEEKLAEATMKLTMKYVMKSQNLFSSLDYSRFSPLEAMARENEFREIIQALKSNNT